jgi:hypothetical protein
MPELANKQDLWILLKSYLKQSFDIFNKEFIQRKYLFSLIQVLIIRCG